MFKLKVSQKCSFFLSFKNHLLSPLVNLLFEAILNIRDGKFGFADWLPPRSLSIVSMAFTKLSSIISLVNKKIQMIRQKYESDNQRYKTAWKMCKIIIRSHEAKSPLDIVHNRGWKLELNLDLIQKEKIKREIVFKHIFNHLRKDLFKAWCYEESTK